MSRKNKRSSAIIKFLAENAVEERQKPGPPDVILPGSIYLEMICKNGENQAKRMLINALEQKDPIMVYKQVFGDHRAVTFNKGKYQYINEFGYTVTTDNTIVIKLAENIRTAMIQAANDAIKDSLINNNIGNLYGTMNIGKMQQNMLSVDLAFITKKLIVFLRPLSLLSD